MHNREYRLDKIDISIWNSIRVTNNRVSGAEIIVFDGSPLIANNEVSGNIIAVGGSPIIASNTINGGGISVRDDFGGTVSSPLISNNLISNHELTGSFPNGIYIGKLGHPGVLLIEKNTVKNSFRGIMVSEEAYGDSFGRTVKIQNNDVVDNQMGIHIYSPATITTVTNNNIFNNEVGSFLETNSPPKIIYNNIYENNFNVRLSFQASSDVNLTYNWWGTTDTSVIDQKIWDFNDDFDLGKVNYTPFLTEPNTQAMPDPTAQIPTMPSPEPSASPTSDTSFPPQNHPQSGPQIIMQLGLGWIEIATLALLTAAVVLLAIIIAIMRAKKKQKLVTS